MRLVSKKSPSSIGLIEIQILQRTVAKRILYDWEVNMPVAEAAVYPQLRTISNFWKLYALVISY